MLEITNNPGHHSNHRQLELPLLSVTDLSFSLTLSTTISSIEVETEDKLYTKSKAVNDCGAGIARFSCVLRTAIFSLEVEVHVWSWGLDTAFALQSLAQKSRQQQIDMVGAYLHL
jgi:hypothetical protein